MLAGIFTLLFIKDPARLGNTDDFDEKLNKKVTVIEKDGNEEEENEGLGIRNFIKQMKSIKDNKICKNIMIAGSLRSFGNMAISCYLPVYFQKVFPTFSTEYSLLSAASLSSLGFTSVIIGGWISQKYEKKNYMV